MHFAVDHHLLQMVFNDIIHIFDSASQIGIRGHQLFVFLFLDLLINVENLIEELILKLP